MAEVIFPVAPGFRWLEAPLTTPLAVNAGDEFIVSVNINNYFVISLTGLASYISNGDLISVNGGLYSTTPGIFPTVAPGNLPDYFTDILFLPSKAFNCASDNSKAQSLIDKREQPQSQTFNDNVADFEFGIRLTPQVDGYITAIKYYQASGETMSGHIGKIWSSSGTLLGSVNFADSPGGGWKTATLNTAFRVNAATEYIISVNSRTNYSGSNYYFAQSLTNGDLYAPVNAGVYNTTGGQFPSASFNSSNYFRDVIFYNDNDYNAAFGSP